VRNMYFMAKFGGARALVCSPQELDAVVLSRTDDFIFITPGVRPEWAPANDQVRMMTPMEAVAAGADYLVIGRPITQPPADAPGINGSSEAAAIAIADEIVAGMAQRIAAIELPSSNDM
jgi:orotidine-5'-phosphate decarboxylase